MAVTDYHLLIAAEVKKVVEGLALGAPVTVLEDLDDIGRMTTLPVIAVIPVGPELEREEMSTNIHTGIGWPCLVALCTNGVTSGEKSPGMPSLTAFRRAIHATFDKKRALSGHTDDYVKACVCEADPYSVLFDKGSPAHERLHTYLTVTAVGRFPRS